MIIYAHKDTYTPGTRYVESFVHNGKTYDHVPFLVLCRATKEEFIDYWTAEGKEASANRARDIDGFWFRISLD